jgi:cytochrome c5
MYRFLCISLTGMYVLGCTPDSVETNQPTPPASEPTAATQAQTELPGISGEEAYNLACASCHETGVDSAPVTGDPDAWSGRSPLWQAVLFEHANSGYMEMPGKGGNPEMSDEIVTVAAEYMLSITYPDRLPD